jgi:L-ascorbate metabolism protein UlaG (beta-lactamase superfamily)
MYLTWLDSNSWLIELGGKRILMDPWLVGDLMFGQAKWFFRGFRQADRPIPENIDLILLSQGLEDHAHPATLKALDKAIPVVGSPSAQKVTTALGFANVTPLNHGETFTLGDLTITATPGSPTGPTTVENGYILKAEGTSLYYEPHGVHSWLLKNPEAIDVVLTPTIDLALPLIGPIIKGSKASVDLAKQVQPQFIIPTAAGGDIDFEGILIKFLKATGSSADLQNQLTAARLDTQVLDPKPGDRFQVPLKTPALN